jgi:hypothetical protein
VDARTPIFELNDDTAPQRYSPRDFGDFVCTQMEQRDIERDFYMYVYKTRRCEGFPYNCQCDGLDYHRIEESRR